MRSILRARVAARSFVLATALALAATALVASPANASTGSVSDFAGLSAAVGSTGTVTVDAAISAPTESITATGMVTIDLKGHNVSLRRVVVSSTSTLIITNSSSTRATFTADASTLGNKAAFSTTNATLEIGGNTDVVALGGFGGAGVGGDTGDGGGITKVSGNSTLHAVGAGKGAGIGAGQDGSGTTSTLNISGTAVVTVEADPSLAQTAIGDFNSIGVVTIGAGSKLIIPAGTTVVMNNVPGSTVNNAGTIIVNGTFTGAGTPTNSGSIGGTGAVTISGVSGTHFTLTFDPDGGTVGGPSTMTVYSDTFLDAVQSIPTASKVGSAFDGWWLNGVQLITTTSLSTVLGSGVKTGTPKAVWKANATVTLDAVAAPVYGSPFTLTSTVSGNASGIVEFFATTVVSPITTVSLGASPTALGVATVSGTWTRPAAEYLITASFSGDNAAGTSNQRVVTAGKGISTGGFISASGTVSVGQAASLVVQLTQHAATGTVKFSIDGTDYTTPTLLDGSASFVTPTTLTAGVHTVSAFYSGDANWTASAAQYTLTVAAATVTTGVTSGTGSTSNTSNSSATTTTAATSTALWLTAPATVYGGLTTLTAHIGGNSTGTVTFSAGSTILGSAPVVGGFAALAVPTLNVGSHAIAASYSGDATHAASVSSAALLKITKATTKATVTAKKFKKGKKPTVTVTLKKLANGTAVTGKVAIFVGNKKVKTVTVTKASTKVKLPKKYAKSITVTAKFLGSKNVVKATSKAKKVTAK